jgi:D-glycero-alpha-D-manno-heptose-7-phosphate kinase
MLIHARAPLRLGLAGGGTDVSPYSDFFGGRVVNATIDKYAYVELETRTDENVSFHSTDFGLTLNDSITSAFSSRSEMPLHTAVYSRMINEFNGRKPIALNLTTFSDAPVGSGLGASSTLVVAMVKAFDCLLNLGLNAKRVAEIAFEVERNDCGLAGGKQDQYSAAFGGFNYMEFEVESTNITNLQPDSNFIAELEASLVLFYTGVSRASAEIINDQSKSLQESGDSALNAMHAIRAEAIQMKEILISGQTSDVVESMKTGWLNKKLTSNSVSNSHIDTIFDAAIAAGALAGKVSGAGGGGFMWFYCPVSKKAEVLQELAKFEGNTSNCHFSIGGAQAWKLN